MNDSETTNRPAVLVTGAGGALGRSVVAALLAAGERVAAIDGRSSSLSMLAPSQLLSTYAADLTNTEEVERLFAQLAADHGGPRAVIHLVGGFAYGQLATFSDQDWDRLLAVNLHTTFRVFRAAARHFQATGGGALVAVASPAAIRGEAGFGAYAACKAAVLRMVESLARELSACGGRANAVLPGTMDTPANRAAMPDVDPRTWVRTEEVAAVLLSLISPATAAVNGAAIPLPEPGLRGDS